MNKEELDANLALSLEYFIFSNRQRGVVIGSLKDLGATDEVTYQILTYVEYMRGQTVRFQEIINRVFDFIEIGRKFGAGQIKCILLLLGVPSDFQK